MDLDLSHLIGISDEKGRGKPKNPTSEPVLENPQVCCANPSFCILSCGSGNAMEIWGQKNTMLLNQMEDCECTDLTSPSGLPGHLNPGQVTPPTPVLPVAAALARGMGALARGRDELAQRMNAVNDLHVKNVTKTVSRWFGKLFLKSSVADHDVVLQSDASSVVSVGELSFSMGNDQRFVSCTSQLMDPVQSKAPVKEHVSSKMNVQLDFIADGHSYGKLPQKQSMFKECDLPLQPRPSPINVEKCPIAVGEGGSGLNISSIELQCPSAPVVNEKMHKLGDFASKMADTNDFGVFQSHGCSEIPDGDFFVQKSSSVDKKMSFQHEKMPAEHPLDVDFHGSYLDKNVNLEPCFGDKIPRMEGKI